ncbi:MAG: TspO/MBR family protein, partial [Candidatus Diapherotrites archaeon]
LMGIALYIVWTGNAEKKQKQKAMKIFGIQLALNALWSIIFFGLQNPWLAFVEIIVLWSAIMLTIKHFYKISKNSAYLLIPYILWVSFAAILNLAIAILN